MNDAIAASEIGSSQAQGKVASKTQGVGKSQLADLSHPSSTSTHGSSGSRPSSNYSSRSQQSVGTQKGMILVLFVVCTSLYIYCLNNYVGYLKLSRVHMGF